MTLCLLYIYGVQNCKMLTPFQVVGLIAAPLYQIHALR